MSCRTGRMIGNRIGSVSCHTGVLGGGATGDMLPVTQMEQSRDRRAVMSHRWSRHGIGELSCHTDGAVNESWHERGGMSHRAVSESLDERWHDT